MYKLNLNEQISVSEYDGGREALGVQFKFNLNKTVLLMISLLSVNITLK